MNPNARKSSTTSSINVEEIFLKREVQELLKKVTSVDINKVYAHRLKNKGSREQRMHYAMMTDEKLAQVKEKYAKMAEYFLQLIPIKEPLPETFKVITKDEELDGHDESSYVFYDIRDALDQDRLVVYREPDGTLRTAKPQELRRLNRAFYPRPNKPVYVPPVFFDPALEYALNLNKHELVMDFACWFFEPDELQFVQLIQEVIDRTVRDNKLENLYGTRHFSTLTFYLTLNKNIEPLFKFFVQKKDTASMANIVRLYKIMHTDWRTASAGKDADTDDFKLVYDFATQYQQFQDPNIIKYLNLDIIKPNRTFRSLQ
uniref:Uncharacterized protein n=1 Tax=Acrobeloides nanus TaxID=290746 RepID=A0A914EHR4_9BILA